MAAETLLEGSGESDERARRRGRAGEMARALSDVLFSGMRKITES